VDAGLALFGVRKAVENSAYDPLNRKHPAWAAGRVMRQPQ